MRRREFVALLGGAGAWPLGAAAQQPRTPPKIGFLGVSTRANWTRWVNAFVGRLSELGWIEDRTVTIEFRWAEGRTERFAEIATEFVGMRVDVIVTAGIAVSVAKQVTADIPIVFAIAADPVGAGLVASLSAPGGNVTGLSNQYVGVATKRLELLREVIPDLQRLAVMGNVAYASIVQEIGRVRDAGRQLGIDVVDTLEVRKPEDIAPSLAAVKNAPQALYVCGEALMNANRVGINRLALMARLPTTYPERSYLEGGGFMSYGVDQTAMFRRAADYVDRIFRGAKPGELPVEEPTKFEMVINLQTAKALGLSIPESLLARADDVIE